MKVFDTPLEGLKRICLSRFNDPRGFFVERYRDDFFRRNVADVALVQDNFSRSSPGTIRGLHYQVNPGQGKLVGVTSGRIFDVAVDIRKGSPTFGKWFGTELNEENQELLWIPNGFAHGFCVIGSERADVSYKVTGYYSAAGDRGIRFDDPEIAVAWPIPAAAQLISDRDRKLPSLREISA